MRLGLQSDYKNCRPPTHPFFSSQLSSSPCPIQLPPFFTFSLPVIRLIGRRNGPLRSFRSHSPSLLDTRRWPVHDCTYTDCSQWCPDVPSDSAGLRTLPVHCLSAHFFQIIQMLSSLMFPRSAPTSLSQSNCPWDPIRIQ